MLKSTFIGRLVMGLFATCATAVPQEPAPEVEPAPRRSGPRCSSRGCLLRWSS